MIGGAIGTISFVNLRISIRLKKFINSTMRNTINSLVNYSNNNGFKLIKMETRTELSNRDVKELLSKAIDIRNTDFPNSNIKYSFVEGYSLDLKGERFPFNIVVLSKEVPLSEIE